MMVPQHWWHHPKMHCCRDCSSEMVLEGSRTLHVWGRVCALRGKQTASHQPASPPPPSLFFSEVTTPALPMGMTH